MTTILTEHEPQTDNLQPDPLVLGPECNGLLMTPEEFDAIEEYDDQYRYELINGVLIVNPIPLPAERGPSELLAHLLFSYQESHPQGAALDDTLPEEYVRTTYGRRRADRLIWAGLGRTPDRKSDLPTIIVEFVSKSRRDWRRDYVAKRDEYLALGVAEYWVIDRFRRTLTVFKAGKAGPEQQVLGEKETYESPRLPGFQLPLARVLKAADKWQSTEPTE